MVRAMNATQSSRLIRFGTLACALALACGSSGDDTSAGSTSTGTSTSAEASAGTGTSTSTATDVVITSGGGTSTSDEPTSTGITTSTTTGTTTDPTTGDASTSLTTTTGIEEGSLSFFVSSTGSKTGNLGSLVGADERCQTLGDAAGAGDREWRAYLSIEKGLDDGPVHAKDRIGAGPWYNANGVMIASDVADLHTKEGDPTLFVDEYGDMINGQWEGSPDPNEHDILTGTNKDGTVAVGKTCEDWNSEDPTLFAMVGHSDGLGPNMSDDPMYRSWNSVHDSGGCNDTAPKGGSGRIYCFAAD